MLIQYQIVIYLKCALSRLPTKKLLTEIRLTWTDPDAGVAVTPLKNAWKKIPSMLVHRVICYIVSECKLYFMNLKLSAIGLPL